MDLYPAQPQEVALSALSPPLLEALWAPLPWPRCPVHRTSGTARDPCLVVFDWSSPEQPYRVQSLKTSFSTEVPQAVQSNTHSQWWRENLNDMWRWKRYEHWTLAIMANILRSLWSEWRYFEIMTIVMTPLWWPKGWFTMYQATIWRK